MKKRIIDLHALKPHGQVKSEIIGKNLCFTVLSANPISHCKNIGNPHYLELPERYKLPLRIDVTAKIDAPALYLLLGKGHANFGVHWSDNRRLDDICEATQKVNHFNGHIPMNKFAKISLIYDFKEMQILVNDETRYYSKKEKYMKSPLLEQMNAEGFSFRISCDKRTEATIKSISITEYDGTAKIEPTAVPMESKPPVQPVKVSFEETISGLPKSLQKQITDLDAWLRQLRPLKFKRQVEKYGNKISYVASDYGFSYAIHPSNDVLYHTLQWYIVTSGKAETWGRKANQMEEVLNCLAQKDPDFAQRMFDNLYECVGGYGPGCLAKTPYAFNGKRKVSCHGKMRFKMTEADFNDARRFIDAANGLIRT